MERRLPALRGLWLLLVALLLGAASARKLPVDHDVDTRSDDDGWDDWNDWDDDGYWYGEDDDDALTAQDSNTVQAIANWIAL